MADNKISGWLVVFGGRDLMGDYFDAKTDFDLGTRSTISVFYDHGMDARLRRLRIGTGEVRLVQQKGLWIDASPISGLPKKFWDGLRAMAADGELGWSSGAVGHLVEREADGYLSMWHLGEASLTCEPAEPKARATAEKTVTRAQIPTVTELREAWVGHMKRLTETRIWLSREWLREQELEREHGKRRSESECTG